MEHYEKAMKEYQKAMELEPDETLFRLDISSLSSQMERSEKGQAELQKMEELEK